MWSIFLLIFFVWELLDISNYFDDLTKSRVAYQIMGKLLKIVSESMNMVIFHTIAFFIWNASFFKNFAYHLNT